MWGLFVFAPLSCSDYVQPFLIHRSAACRSSARSSPARPTASASSPPALILAIMILPVHRLDHRATCSSIVPADAQGSGLRPRLHHAGKWCATSCCPYTTRRRHRRHHAGPRPRARRDHGRHLRDRQRHKLSGSLLAPGNRSISATIANEFTEAVGDIYTSSLIALGLILFVHHLHRAGGRKLHAGAAVAQADRMTDHDRSWLYDTALPPAPRAQRASSWRCRSPPRSRRPRLAVAGSSADPAGEGLRRPVARACSPRSTPPPGASRRPAQRHRRQPDDDVAGGR